MPDEDIGSGLGYVHLSQTLKGLEGRTTYHYRITAISGEETLHSADRTFGTTKPQATTEAASEVHANDATLNATVNPEAADTSYWFEYGIGTSYGRQAPVKSGTLNAGLEDIAVTATAWPLTGSATYHYRIVAENSAGVSYGKDETFTTPASQWAVQRLPKQPENPLPGKYPFNNGFKDVSCVSQDECMAVGLYFSNAQQMDSRHWNGEEWTTEPMAAPEDAIESFVTDISCSSATWCVAVGEYYTESFGELTRRRPLLEHWDGSKWTADTDDLPQPLEEDIEHEKSYPVIAGKSLFKDVSCTSRYACLAVGQREYPDPAPFVYRWDGEEWSTLPALPAGITVPSSLSCTSSAWCMLAGKRKVEVGSWATIVLAWNGEDWSVVREGVPNGTLPVDVSCATPQQCTVARYSSTDTGEAHIERWDGSTWAQEDLPNEFGAEEIVLYDVSCPALDFCAAVGLSKANGAFIPTDYAWNGSEWSLQSTSEPLQEEEGPIVSFGWLEGVSCASASSCVGVGHDKTQDTEAQESEIRGTLASYRAPGPGTRTGHASEIETSRATLNATVNPQGLETTYQFEYGESVSYGSKAPLPAEGAGAGDEDTTVSQALGGLERGTTYHYRVRATNAEGTTYGEDETFTTRAPPPSFAHSFGEAGAGEGQLDEPYGLALDSEGHIWLADSENSRIEEFGPDGQLLRQLGSEGAGAGQVQQPYGIAVGPEGNAWVADSFNSRIDVFGPEGEFLKAIGWGVADGESPELQVCTTTCFGGIAGTGEGQLHHPYGLDFDSEGHLWVISTWGDRVVEFNREGEYLSQFEVGGGGYSDIAVDAEDDLWVVSYNEAVKKFSPAGELLVEFGEEGTGEGQFDFPTGISVDAEGNLWVADSENDRVQEFNPQGQYLAQFGESGAAEGQLDFPRKVAFDSEGDLWLADSENNRVEEWTYGPSAVTEAAVAIAPHRATLNATVNPQGLETTYQFEYGKTQSYGSAVPASPASLGSGAEDVSPAKTVKGLAHGTTYHYRVVATNARGTTRGGDRTFTTHALAPSLRSSFGEAGAGEGQLDEPYGLALDSEGHIWLADSENSRIEEFGPDGQLLRQLGSEGAGAGQVQQPYGIAVGPEGNAWVADSFNSRIDVFGPEGEFLKAIGWGVADGESPELQVCTTTCFGGIAGTGEGQLHHPYGLDFDSEGHLWVISTWGDRVVEFNREGEYLSQFEVGGGGYSDIAVDAEDDLWVVSYNEAVKKFSPAGELLVEFGEEGTGEGQFDFPTGISVDAEGNLWVADSENDRVQEFNPQGQYLAQFGESGAAEGQLDFPRKVAFDSEGDLWLADSENNRVEEWTRRPLATTEAAINVKTTRATLGATVNPNGEETAFWFEFGKTTSYGSKIPSSPKPLGSQTSAVAVFRTPTGLSPGTTYHYRVVAENEDGSTHGADRTFTTSAGPLRWYGCVERASGKYPDHECSSEGGAGGWESLPLKEGEGTAIAGAGEGLTLSAKPYGVAIEVSCEAYELSGASLENPSDGGSSVGEAEFEYEGCEVDFPELEATCAAGMTGATLELELATVGGEPEVRLDPAEGAAVAGLEITEEGCPLKGSFPINGSLGALFSNAESQLEFTEAGSEGLTLLGSPATAAGTLGASLSGGGHLRAEAAHPIAYTEAVSGIEPTGATLNGTVNPEGLDTHYQFEWGKTAEYGNSMPAEAQGVGSGAEDIAVSESLEGLEPGTTYHYRVVAESIEGTVTGQDRVFVPSEWILAPTEQPTESSSNELASSSCVSASSCLAVGSYENSAGTYLTLAERREGEEWAIQPTPNPEGAKESRLRSVSCTTASDCVAVGTYKNASGTILTLAERYDGEQWSLTPSPNPEGALESQLKSVSCSSATDCTAVGYYYLGSSKFKTLIEHYDGEQWSLVSSPNPEGYAQSFLYSVSCATGSDCWAVGKKRNSSDQALLKHYDGEQWSLAPISEPPAKLVGVSCSSTSFCVAVVGSGLGLRRWDGSSWSAQSATQPPETSGGQLLGVSCVSATACTVAGNVPGKDEYPVPLAEHWDGSEWTVQETTDPLQTLEELPSFPAGGFEGVSCATASACVATGFYFYEGSKMNLIAETHAPGTAPTAITEAASGLTTTSVTLNATVNPGGEDTTYRFEYGPTVSYGASVPASGKAIGSGVKDIEVSQAIEGLEPGQTYHYRVVAGNIEGTVEGEDMVFVSAE